MNNQDFISKKACYCPYCNSSIPITKDFIEKYGAIKCTLCGRISYPYIHEETDTIEISKKFHHTKGEDKAYCDCPYCNSSIPITKDFIEKYGAIKCTLCGRISYPYIHEETDTIEISKKFHHTKGEDKAYCDCPYCNSTMMITRNEAENNIGTKCARCGKINILCINYNNDTIQLQPAKNKNIFNYDNNSYVFIICPNCNGENIFENDFKKENFCRWCGKKIYYMINENENDFSNEEYVNKNIK